MTSGMQSFLARGAFSAVASVFLIGSVAVAAPDGGQGPASRVANAAIGLSRIGKAVTASPAARGVDGVVGRRATVLLFVSPVCPITNQYAPELAALANAYHARGVAVVRVYSSAGATPEAITKHGAAFGLAQLPALDDRDGRLAALYGATVTPQAVLLDAKRAVRYSGRIDDRFVDRGKSRATGATTHDLREALDRVLAGKAVAVARTRAVGCAIERATPVVAETTGPTYAHDIAGLIQQNCVTCHRAGQIGPMPLETYDQVKHMASNIAAVTGTRQMPPWKAVPGSGDFVGERRLTTGQIALLKTWAERGAPGGDLALVPPEPRFAAGWTQGTPDLVLTIPTVWHTDAKSEEIYRCFVLPTGLTEDKQVVGIEYRPGNRSVVHHCLGYIDTAGKGRARDGADGRPGYTSFGGPGFLPQGELSGWAPGNLPQFLPDGVGRLLPKGSDVILQVHYHPTGKPEDDQTQVGLYFARKPVTQKLRTIPLVAKVNIPAGDAHYETTTTMNVPFDANLISVMPHMHLLGRTIDMSVTLPDGTTKPLIKVDDWYFNWQGTYTYKKALYIPKGSVVSLKATYDNSAANPRNPHSPPQPIHWGEKTTDEMCIGFISFVVADENDPTVRFLDGVFGGKHASASR